MKAVGARLPRYDGVAHVTGQTQYVDDIRVRGTLWTKALRSPHANAAIKRLDTSKAEALAGVHAVVTHEDVPHNVYGHLEALGIPPTSRCSPSTKSATRASRSQRSRLSTRTRPARRST